MMEKLVPVFNLIDGALTKAGLDDKIELPRIAVIGSQSSGKSSVLESIAGFDFLPRGIGLVTRCPIIMQCVKSNISKPYVVFGHKPEERLTDFKKVREEIKEQTNVLAGTGKEIVKTEIIVTIYSKDVVDLTLIDLPGFIKVAEEGLPENLPKTIQRLVRKYIIKESTCILAIHSATEDIANSESLQFARKYDPNGERTLGVLTKIDLMDKGTNALSLLKGKEYQLKQGYVAVKGRSQQDIKDGKTIKHALAEEKKFFRENPDYSDISEKQGIKYLSNKISALMQKRIEKCLPNIQNKITSKLNSDRSKLETLSNQNNIRTEDEANSFIGDKITVYSEKFRELINGTHVKNSTEELRGGAKINAIVNTSFRDVIDELNPFDCLKEKEIRTAIENARGFNPELMIPEEAVRILIKQQIPRLSSPWNQFWQLIHDEMVKMISLIEHEELQKYARLMNYIVCTMTELLKKHKTNVLLMIANTIASESAIINFDHDDFIYLKHFCTGDKKITEHDLVRIEQNLKVNRNYFTEDFKDEENEGLNYKVYDEKFEADNTNYASDELSQKEKNYIPSYSPEEFIKKNAPHIKLKKVGDKLEVKEDATTKEERQVMIMKRLIICYFSIIKKQIKDSIPKTVIWHLVQETVKRMNFQLINGLTKIENKVEMLQENQQDKFEREILENNISALSESLTLINKVTTVPKVGIKEIKKSSVGEKKRISKELEKKSEYDMDSESIISEYE